MIKLGPVVVVEGKYDKNKIKQIFDCTVIDTQGFGIYSDKEKLALLRRLAETRGLLIITDADDSGLQIRNFLKGSVSGKVWHAYIPDICGKERRKHRPSARGLLGVEGVDDRVIIEAVKQSGAMEGSGDSAPKGPPITRGDFYELGLSGREDSARLRKRLCAAFSLPQNLGTGALIDVLNLITDREGLISALQSIFKA